MRDLHQVPSMYASLPGALERHLGSSMSNSMGGMPLSTSGTGKGLSIMELASKAQGMDGAVVPDGKQHLNVTLGCLTGMA